MSAKRLTSEAADAVILETSLGRVDELIHIARRMRHIALQSAIGGMALSILGMFAAALGYLPPIGQELMRHANSRLTLDVYAQALTPAKRAAHLKVVELIGPTVGTISVPLCSHAEKAESVSA